MLFGTFGFIGLVLAGVGLFGVMSYSVVKRHAPDRHPLALGAKPLCGTAGAAPGMVLTIIAIALGWPAAWMLAKIASSFLYGIQPHGALTFALVPPFLTLVALAACYIPARRAPASVNPMQALRANSNREQKRGQICVHSGHLSFAFRNVFHRHADADFAG